MNRRRDAALLLVLAVLVGPAVRADEVTLSAAASLADAVTEIAHAFESVSGPSVALNFGGSSELARQIRGGAPADVFFSADSAQMDTLEKAGLVRHADRVDVLSNTL